MKPTSFLLLISSLFFLNACSPSSASPTALAEENLVFTDGQYHILPQKSTLYWEGVKEGGLQLGILNLERGELRVRNQQPVYGSFVIEMNSLASTNLGFVEAEALANLLKSDLFFHVKRYPKARFDITQIKPYVGFEDYNYVITGDLSFKDKGLSVPILSKITQNEDRLTVYGRAEIDQASLGLNFSDGTDATADNVIFEIDLLAEKIPQKD